MSKEVYKIAGNSQLPCMKYQVMVAGISADIISLYVAAVFSI